jgi:hypothetical protein
MRGRISPSVIRVLSLLPLIFVNALAGTGSGAVSGDTHVLAPEAFKHHVDYFNSMVEEGVVNHIANAQAWQWMKGNIPLFACPDRNVEQIYYYRWWTLRRHIKKTPVCFILTEFIRPVGHSAQYNAISCALGHHIAEARWVRDRQYLDEYISFWLRSGENGGLHPRLHQFSGWTAAAVYERWLVDGNTNFLTSLLDSLVLDYRKWEEERLLGSGLFWQSDVADGMEESISGSRKAQNARPTINSYMYGNAQAIAAIAAIAGKSSVGARLRRKSRRAKAVSSSVSLGQVGHLLQGVAGIGNAIGRSRAIGVHSLVFQSTRARKGLRRGLEAADGPERFLRSLRPHHS